MRLHNAEWGLVFLGMLLAAAAVGAEGPLPDGAVRRLGTSPEGQRGKLQEVRGLAFGPRGQTLAVVRRASVELWDAAAGRQLRRLDTGEQEVVGVAFSPDGETLATGNREQICLWDVGTGQRLRFLDGQGGRGGGVAFSADGRQVVGIREGSTQLTRRVTEESAVIVWDAETGKKLREFFVARHPQSEFHATVFLSPDGKTSASTDASAERIQLWDVFSGHPSVQVPAGAYTERPLFSPDGRALIARAPDGKLGLWEVMSARPRLEVVGFLPLAFSPDGRLLAVEDTRAAVRVYELGGGKELLRTAALPEGTTAAAFSADGRLFAVGQADGTVLAWNVSDLLKNERPVVPLADKELESAWQDLAAEDARRAYRAIEALAARPEQATAFFKERLRPAKELPRVERLLRDLDDDRFETREAASREMIRLGAEVLPAVRVTLEGKPSLELRRRLEALLSDPAIHLWSGESLRPVRALEVLEKIGTDDARRLTEALAKGPEKAALTHEARAALARLEARRPRS
jgi:WD40 repeat protein